jgi:peptidoglycan/LPS O-acetylase OafA/YrhL
MATDHFPEFRPDLDEQLRAAETGGIGGARLARSADLAEARYAATMATLVALYLLVVVYIYPQEILWLDLATTAAFTAGLVGTCRSYGRRRRASGLGWSRRYSAGFVLSSLLFGLGLVLLGLTESRDAWLWFPYAAATGVPLMAGVSDRLPGGFRAWCGWKTP